MVPEDPQLRDLFSLFYFLPRAWELSHINQEASDLQCSHSNVFHVFIENLVTGPRSLGFIPQKPAFSSQISEYQERPIALTFTSLLRGSCGVNWPSFNSVPSQVFFLKCKRKYPPAVGKMAETHATSTLYTALPAPSGCKVFSKDVKKM